MISQTAAQVKVGSNTTIISKNSRTVLMRNGIYDILSFKSVYEFPNSPNNNPLISSRIEEFNH